MALVRRVRTAVSRGWTALSVGTSKTSPNDSPSPSLPSTSIEVLPCLEIDGVWWVWRRKSSREEDERGDESVENQNDVECDSVSLQASRQRRAAGDLLHRKSGAPHRGGEAGEGCVVASG